MATIIYDPCQSSCRYSVDVNKDFKRDFRLSYFCNNPVTRSNGFFESSRWLKLVKCGLFTIVTIQQQLLSMIDAIFRALSQAFCAVGVRSFQSSIRVIIRLSVFCNWSIILGDKCIFKFCNWFYENWYSWFKVRVYFKRSYQQSLYFAIRQKQPQMVEVEQFM